MLGFVQTHAAFLLFFCTFSFGFYPLWGDPPPTAAQSPSVQPPQTEIKKGKVVDLATAEPPKKLIFLDFYNESKDVNAKWVEDSIGESIYELTKSKYNYVRIPKEEWKKYVTSQGLTPADLYDTTKLQKMGLALAADGIIFGKFTTSNNKLEISGKILSVVDREIVVEKNAETPMTSEMFEEVKVVSEALGSRIKDLFYPSDRGALWRSAMLPGWGQFYKQRRTWGKIYGGVIGTGVLFTGFSFFMWQKTNSDYRNYNPDHVVTPQGETALVDPLGAKAEFDRLQAKSAQWQQITLISLGITGIIYAWNLFDAWFFDGEYIHKGPASGSAFNGRFGREPLFGRVTISGDQAPLSMRFSFPF